MRSLVWKIYKKCTKIISVKEGDVLKFSKLLHIITLSVLLVLSCAGIAFGGEEHSIGESLPVFSICLLYTSDAADE